MKEEKWVWHSEQRRNVWVVFKTPGNVVAVAQKEAEAKQWAECACPEDLNIVGGFCSSGGWELGQVTGLDTDCELETAVHSNWVKGMKE